MICLLGWTSLRSKRWMCFQGIESVHFDIRLQPLFTSPEMWWLVWCSSVVHLSAEGQLRLVSISKYSMDELVHISKGTTEAVSPVQLCQPPRRSLRANILMYMYVFEVDQLLSFLCCFCNSNWLTWSSKWCASFSFPSPDYTMWATKTTQCFLK